MSTSGSSGRYSDCVSRSRSSPFASPSGCCATWLSCVGSLGKKYARSGSPFQPAGGRAASTNPPSTRAARKLQPESSAGRRERNAAMSAESPDGEADPATATGSASDTVVLAGMQTSAQTRKSTAAES